MTEYKFYTLKTHFIAHYVSGNDKWILSLLCYALYAVLLHSRTCCFLSSKARMSFLPCFIPTTAPITDFFSSRVSRLLKCVSLIIFN